MLRRLRLAALCVLAMSWPSHAQQGPFTIGVNGCGTTPVSKNIGAQLTVDYNTGILCTTAGGGGGTVTANQGTAAAAAGAWPTYLVQGTTANASGNPIFAQLTAGAAAIGSITNTTFAATQSGTWNIGSITTLPAVTQGTSPWVDNITQFGGVALSTGTGASGTGIPRVTVSNDSTVGLVAGAAAIGSVLQTTPTTVPFTTAEQGSAASTVGITPATASASAGIVVKASAGNLYGGYATNQTATAGWLIAYNATAVPGTGALTAASVLDCVPLPASANASVNYGPGPPEAFSTGIVLLVSSGSCTTYTTGVITAYIHGSAR